MDISDEEVYANRLKWIEHLKHPKTKKYRNFLESYLHPKLRCCLGHACHVLIPNKRVYQTETNSVVYSGHYTTLPDELVHRLGLFDDSGSTNGNSISYTIFPDEYDGPIYEDEADDEEPINYSSSSLVTLNDNTSITPQEIGAYLESVIMGGDNTPFKKISISSQGATNEQ